MIIINNQYVATHEGLLDIATGGETMVDFLDVVDNISKIEFISLNKYDIKIWLDWKERYKWHPDMEKVNMF